MTSVKANIHWPSIASRGMIFSLIWWILTDGAVSSWWIGVPAVLLAVTVSTALIPPVPLIWHHLLRFVPFFLMHSLLGGVDVARRAFHPRLPIAPDLITYPLRLPAGLPQALMTNIVSLLPGTLSAVLDRNVLQVHVLDRHKDVQSELQAVEQMIARMFYVTE